MSPRSYGTTNAIPLASPPPIGAAGDSYYDTTYKTLCISDGTAWGAVAGQYTTNIVVDYGTTDLLPSYTYNNAAGTITSTVNAVFTVDGASPAAGRRILVKNSQGVVAGQNGLYAVTNPGSASTPWILTRTNDPITTGTQVYIRNGSTLANSVWLQQNGPPPITLGTTAQLWMVVGQLQVTGNNAGVPGFVGTAQGGLPTGGSAGQVLAKNSATSYDTLWVSPYGTIMGAPADFNGDTTTGIYFQLSSNPNGPPGNVEYGFLQVFNFNATNITQVWTAEDGTQHAMRGYTGAWSPWQTGIPPAVATTVAGPDAFGAASVVGSSALYARADHHHGLPATPAPYAQVQATAPNASAPAIAPPAGFLWVDNSTTATWAAAPFFPSQTPPVSGFNSFTDGAGDVWVSLNGSAWKRARDALHCRVYRNTAFTPTVAWAAVLFDTVDRDLTALYAPATGRFTAPVAGWYLVNGIINSGAPATGQYINSAIYKNGASYANTGQQTYSGSGNWPVAYTSATLWAAAGDYFQVYLSATIPSIAPGSQSFWATFDYMGTG